MSDNPLATFTVPIFLEKRREEEKEEYNRNVVYQAGQIQKNIQAAKLSKGYVVLPGTITDIYPENLKHLKNNGFRVWSITETTPEHIRDFLFITWDCDDFKKYYDEYIKIFHKQDLFLKRSYKEVI